MTIHLQAALLGMFAVLPSAVKPTGSAWRNRPVAQSAVVMTAVPLASRTDASGGSRLLLDPIRLARATR